jgi:multidrug efflux pump subunit AcrA (membrane-fusion protein)
MEGRSVEQPISIDITLEKLLDFDGQPEIFAMLLLAERCRFAGAESGVLFSFDRTKGDASAHAVFPPLPDGSAPEWFEGARQSALASAFGPLPKIVPGKSAGGFVILVPLRINDLNGREEYAAYAVPQTRPDDLKRLLSELGETAAVWRNHMAKLSAGSKTSETAAPVLSILAEVNAAGKFKQAAMAFCNELSTKFGCDRVAVGFVKGRYVRLAAVNHAEKVGRKMDLPRLLEAVMEECLDQDEEVRYPGPANIAPINQAQAELVRRFGSGLVYALPLRRGEELVGAVVLEKVRRELPTQQDETLLRLAADLATPRLVELRDRDRWFGARFMAGVRNCLAWFIGPRHTWSKAISLLLLAIVLLGLFLKIPYRVDATFTLRANEKQVIAAAFDGFIEEAPVYPGSVVKKDETLLARLETAETQSRLLTREAEARAYAKEAALALREGKTADSQIAAAKAEQAEAECAMLRERIARAEMLAPIDGMVLTGDWKNRLGGPVKMGDTLFEIAPLSDLEAELFVPDEDIADIHAGQTGELAVAGNPAARFAFTVEQVSPAAELVKQQNVFRVLVRLEERADWLRPGMEGVAKIYVDERSPFAIWTRKAVNWIRMKLWL